MLETVEYVGDKTLREVTITEIMATKGIALECRNPSSNVGIQEGFRTLVGFKNFVGIFLKNRVLNMDGQAVEHVKTLPGWHKKRIEGGMGGEAYSKVSKRASACSMVAKRGSRKIVEGGLALELGVVRKFRGPSTHDVSWLKGMRWRGMHTDSSVILGDMVKKGSKRLAYIRSRGWQDWRMIEKMLMMFSQIMGSIHKLGKIHILIKMKIANF